MKDSFDRFKKRMTQKNLPTLLIVLGGISFYFILQNLNLIFQGLRWALSLLAPFIMGFAFAYLLYPVTSFIELRICQRIWPARPGLNRKLGVFTGLLLVILVLLSLLLLVLPQTIDNITMLINQLPTYVNKVIAIVNAKLTELDLQVDVFDQFKQNSQQLISKITQYLMNSLPTLVNFSSQVTSGITNLGIGVVAAVYLLLGRERFKRQAKKALYAFTKPTTAEHLIDITRLADKTFSGYITAQLTDAVIVGALSFIGLSLIRMPYAALISTILGVMNIIPFFGVIIGTVLASLIILIAAPQKLIILLIFIFVLQQIDGNLINPMLVGDRVGLPPFWVLVAIVVGSGIFGVIGMVVGVPIFAAMYVLLDGLIHRKLEEKEVPGELLMEEPRPPQTKRKFVRLPAWIRKNIKKTKLFKKEDDPKQ